MIKNWYRRLPIAHKIRVLLITAGMAGIFCFGAVYMYIGAQSLMSTIKNEAARTASMFGSRNVTAIKFQSKDFTEKNLRAITDNPAHEAVCIYDAEGKVFGSFSRDPNWECPPVAPEWNGTFKEIQYESSNKIYVLRNIYSDGEVIGATLVVANQDQLATYISSQLGIMGVIALLAFFSCVLLANYLQRLLSRPIIDVARDVQIITEGRFEGRITEKYQDEIGQVAQAFNRVLIHMEEQLEATRKKQEAATNANNATIKGIEELKSQFMESSESFAVYIELVNSKAFGDDPVKYFRYQADVFESLETCNIKIASLKRLADIYASALATEAMEIDFIAHIEDFIKQIKAAAPFIMVRKSVAFMGIQSPLRAKVFKPAWDESFSIIVNLFDTLAGIVEFAPQVNIDFNGLDNTLLIAFVSSENQAGTKAANFVKFGRLADEEGRGIIEENGETGFKKNTIEDPEAAIEFISSDVIQREHLRYIIDSLSYISNANRISVEHKFAKEEFHIILHLDCMVFTNSATRKLELQ